jgi:hypothetical protein
MVKSLRRQHVCVVRIKPRFAAVDVHAVYLAVELAAGHLNVDLTLFEGYFLFEFDDLGRLGRSVGFGKIFRFQGSISLDRELLDLGLLGRNLRLKPPRLGGPVRGR